MSSSPIEPGQVRIGDAERQQTTDKLAQAHALGQLEVDEFHERIEQAQSARTRDDLAALVYDLPGAQPARRDWMSPEAGDRLKAAGAMLASVPRRVWVVVAAILTSMMVAGWIFDGPDYYHRAYHHGYEGGADIAHGPGFFGGVVTMIGLLLMAMVAFRVVRRARARRAASRTGV